MDRRTTDRARWPVRRVRLGDERRRVMDATPTECVAMMWALSAEAWAVAGRRLPSYPREAIPAVLLRPVT